jgi:polysaccharide deacetylase 2 family uncharacterized protein YibQ
MSWKVYARPFNVLETRPKIAILVTGLGIAQKTTEKAIALPGPISLAYVPFARKLKDWINISRNKGHEVMLTLPLEPADFPKSDPGPYALLTSLSSEKNLERLNWIMSRATGYTGFVNYMGSQFMSNEKLITPILSEIKNRGLLYIDTRESLLSVAPKLANGISMPFEAVDMVIDQTPGRASILRSLSKLESLAKQNGYAIAMIHAYPISLDRLRIWTRTLEGKGIALLPVSALITLKNQNNS